MHVPRQSPRNRAIAGSLRASVVLFPRMVFTNGAEVPVWFHLKNKQPFAFAGLWDMWRNIEGEVPHPFTIITTVPNALMRRIHNRMPVIFDRLQAKQWLDPRLNTRPADIATVFARSHLNRCRPMTYHRWSISQSMTARTALSRSQMDSLASCSLDISVSSYTAPL
jgi:putative SOS response-associated peptidase YedK